MTYLYGFSWVTHDIIIFTLPVKLPILIFGNDGFSAVEFTPLIGQLLRCSLSYRKRNDFSAGCSTISTYGKSAMVVTTEQ